MSAAALHAAKHAVDTVSAGAILGTFLGLLPPLAALVASIWYVVQIYESDTVQNYLHQRRILKLRRRQLRLRRARGDPPDIPHASHH